MRLTLLFLLSTLPALANGQDPPCLSGAEVYIPGGGLRSKISLQMYTRTEAYKEHGVAGWDYSAEHPITCEDMASLTGLDANLVNIDSLEGLQFAINLEELNLEDNNVEDISHLAELTKLKVLHLNNNAISELSPLASMTSLEWLSMHGNRGSPSDFEPLKHLSRLKYLSLRTQAREAKGLEHLAKLKNLEHFYLWKNGVFDVGHLAGLDELREVVIGAEQVLNAESLLLLPKLERVHLSSCVRFADTSLLRTVDELRKTVAKVELRLIEDYNRQNKPSLPLCYL